MQPLTPPPNPNKRTGKFLFGAGAFLVIAGSVLYTTDSLGFEFVSRAVFGTMPETVVVSSSPSWQAQYFGAEVCTQRYWCGDDADSDNDGLTNIREFGVGSHPRNPDTDEDGLADGDEVRVFGGNPLNKHSSGSEQYTDGDDASEGWDSAKPGERLTPERIAQIIAAIKEHALHKPTLDTLTDEAKARYEMVILPAS